MFEWDLLVIRFGNIPVLMIQPRMTCAPVVGHMRASNFLVDDPYAVCQCLDQAEDVEKLLAFIKNAWKSSTKSLDNLLVTYAFRYD